MITPLVPIRDLADQIRGVSYAKEDASSAQSRGSVAVLRAGNIQDAQITVDDLVYVPSSCVTENQLLREHDVLIATSSGSLDVVGKAARATTDLGVAFGAFCKVLRPNERVDPRYFAYYFRTAEYRQTISRLAAGVNINNLRNEHLDNLLIPLPSKREQQRIADILDKADAVRRKRKKATVLTDELLRSTFVEMFGDPVTNPKGWPRSTFGDQVELLEYGPRFYNERYSDEGVRIVRITDLDTTGQLDFSAMPRLLVDEKDRTRYLLKPGDVIFARSGATVGKTALSMPGDPEAIPGAYFIRLRFSSEVRPLYARLVLASDRVQQIILSRSRQSAQQNFSGPGIRELPLPIPPMSLQSQLEQIAVRHGRLLERYKRLSAETEALFSSLVHCVFAAAM